MEQIIEENESGVEDYVELLNIVKKIDEISVSDNLSEEDFSKESKLLVQELFQHLKSDLNIELSSDVNAVYGEMSRENLLARVEKVASVVECVATHKPIQVGIGDSHYANSVTANVEGLGIAMAEADAIGPVRILVGLDLKALVGFKNDHMSVSEISDTEFDIRDTKLRKTFCRHVDGEIRYEDIRYVVMRIPRRYFPPQELLDDERNSISPFIFRGAKLKFTNETGEKF